MPKRNSEDLIEHYRKKIRKLEKKRFCRLRRISSSDSEQDSNRDSEVMEPVPTDPTSVPAPATQESPTEETPIVQALERPPDLDPSILAALGEIADEAPEFGEQIHESLTKIWSPILKKGMSKEAREVLLKKYLIPENCTLLQAPTLNPEIQAAIGESGKFRDKKMANSQQQMGSGITAINRGLNLLISNDTAINKVDAIKFISDGCRLLSDLHYQSTETRIKFITPCLDKSFLQILDKSERDNTLFGSNLPDKIKSSKAINKHGQQIKKNIPTPKPESVGRGGTSNVQPNTSRASFQGNWQAPSRFQSNRGGRGGYKKINPRTPSTSAQPRTTHSSSKTRAPRRQ